MKKRITGLWFAVLFICVALLAGCGSKSTAVVASVPDNGIIRKADFQQLKQSDRIAIYHGTSGGVKYTWTFIGRDIQKPADMNLKLSVKSVTAEQADAAQQYQQITFAQKGAFPGAASVSVTLGKKWVDGSYLLCTGPPDTLQQTGTAQVVDGVATIRLSQNKGPYLLSLNMMAPAASSASAHVSSGGTSPAGTSAVSSAAGASGAASSTGASAGGTASSSAGKQTTSKNSGSAAAGSSSTPNTGSTPAQAPVTSTSQEPAAATSNANQTLQVSLSIDCETALKNWSKLPINKQDHQVVPENGIILGQTNVTVNTGETAYNLLVAVCQKNGIQMDASGTVLGKYINGINNLYEFDAGPLSGWEYEVNGIFGGVAVSRYTLKNGDAVQFRYTCDLGRDIGNPHS